jgi:hypothetical protein
VFGGYAKKLQLIDPYLSCGEAWKEKKSGGEKLSPFTFRRIFFLGSMCTNPAFLGSMISGKVKGEKLSKEELKELVARNHVSSIHFPVDTDVMFRRVCSRIHIIRTRR